MPDLVLRMLALLFGAAIVAAATHANVLHAGGYGSADAPLVIALACGLAVAIAFAFALWGEGKKLAAVLLAVCALAGEGYWLLTNAEREIARRDAITAPVDEARKDHVAAAARVEKAETAKQAADAAAISEASKDGCRKNCAALLLSAQQAAETELIASRTALAASPTPRSAAPLPERLGVASWAWDLLLAGLRSLAVVGGSLMVGFSAHPQRKEPGPAEPVARADDKPTLAKGDPVTAEFVEVAADPVDPREHASSFLLDVLQPDPAGKASFKALLRRYPDWCADRSRQLPSAELGDALGVVINAAKLRCVERGNDVIVHGVRLIERKGASA